MLILSLKKQEPAVDSAVAVPPPAAAADGEALAPTVSSGEPVNRGFGKDDTEIGAVGSGGELDYELFSILVHSGGALGGHYYCYTKDLKTKRWMHFNDDDINAVTEEDVRAAYGCDFNRRILISYFEES